MGIGRRWKGRHRLAAGLLALGFVMGAAPGAVASTIPDPGDAALLPPSGAYFGTTIDWSIDSAAAEAERLGRVPALLEHVTRFPVTAAEQTYLEQFIAQAAALGALPVITVEPDGSLDGFGEEEAEDLVGAIARARGERGPPVYLRFAPAMNAPWVPWGLEATHYVAAFRAVADQMQERLPGSAMVWSPTTGAGYPFEATPAPDRLDTDGDAAVSATDDPYGPYYPGESYVDWVGLVAYHDPSGGGAAVNAVPGAGALAAALNGGGDLDFAERFSSDDRPLMLETGAFYAPGAGGASEFDIKREWWRQVIDAATVVPEMAAVVWRDESSTRGVTGRAPIDWSISGDPQLVRAFVVDAEESDLVFGPVYAPSGDAPAGAGPGGVIPDPLGWIVVAVVGFVTVGVLVWGLARPRRSPLSYPGAGDRDLRIDLLRGVAIVFVLVNHLGLPSLFQNATQEAVGMVSGAELFVLLSGVVLAMVYRPKIARDGMVASSGAIGRRAGKIYLAALCVVILVGLLSLLPFLNTSPATSFEDEGTGAAGAGASGRVYDLYSGFDRLFAYPVDAAVFADILLLRIGPWQVNILGFYVVMLLLAPLALWALSKGWWWAVLVAAWGVYAAQTALQWRVLPSQFEDSFPLLTWQALFLTGMVVGYHRRAVVAWFGTRAGRVALAGCVIAAVALALFSWNNPYLSSPLDVRLGLVPPNDLSAVYSVWFERTYLDVGRVVNVLVLTVTAYALLTILWRPIDRAVGWFFIPLGRTTLYVFIMQLLFVLIIANLPFLQGADPWVNTVAYVVVLSLMWLMVRYRFLFGVIPR